MPTFRRNDSPYAVFILEGKHETTLFQYGIILDHMLLGSGNNMLVEKTEIGFCIDRYNTYDELPLEDLDLLPFSVYIIDYNWTYLFINKTAVRVFGTKVQNLVGQNALEVFSHEKFKTIFGSIQKGVNNKVPCDETIYSPLRGKQVKIKGYPLNDCYYFSSITLPAKEELLDELRQELNKRKDAF